MNNVVEINIIEKITYDDIYKLKRMLEKLDPEIRLQEQSTNSGTSKQKCYKLSTSFRHHPDPYSSVWGANISLAPRKLIRAVQTSIFNLSNMSRNIENINNTIDKFVARSGEILRLRSNNTN